MTLAERRSARANTVCRLLWRGCQSAPPLQANFWGVGPTDACSFGRLVLSSSWRALKFHIRLILDHPGVAVLEIGGQCCSSAAGRRRVEAQISLVLQTAGWDSLGETDTELFSPPLDTGLIPHRYHLILLVEQIFP